MVDRLDPGEMALLVIDMQNAFCHEEGTLGRDGVDVSPLRAIIPNIERLVRACRSRGIPDIWTMQEHYQEDKTREAHKFTPHTLKRVNIAALRGTWDAEICAELAPLIGPESHVLRKFKWSAFYGTNLEVLLRVLGRRMLVVCGTTTNLCIDTTVRDAYMRDYDVIVLQDCVAGVNKTWHDAAIQVWNRYIGWVTTLDEFLQRL